MRVLRIGVSVVLAGFAGLFLVGAVALLLAGDLLQIISIVLAAGVLLGSWLIWPPRRDDTQAAVQLAVSGGKEPAPATATGVGKGQHDSAVSAVPASTEQSYPIGQCRLGELTSNDFTVIDVETANSSRASICAIGMAQVRAGKVVTTRSWLVRPPAGHDHFDQRNVRLHGITRPRVNHSGHPWPLVLHQLMEVIGTDVIVAHNASFDVAVVQAATDACRLPSPALVYSDSLNLARQVMPHLVNHKLPTVAQACGVFQRQHHDPADDARVCAEITAHLLAGAPPITIATNGAESLLEPVPAANPAHPLYGKHVVITGHLATMSKDDAKHQIAAVGGIVRGTVSANTDFLIEGVRTGYEKSPRGSQKRLRALELQSDGHRIQLISETQLEALLSSSDPRPAEHG